MTCTPGEILEANFGDYHYNLALINFEGKPSAVFVTFNEIEGNWVGMEIPHILRKFPELLEQFVQALQNNGYTLITAPTVWTEQ